MITVNIDVVDGLVNCAVGNLAHTEVDKSRCIKRLWLNFECGGRLARLKVALLRSVHGSAVSLDWVPIEKRTVTTTLTITCRRTQFPVVQASAITIHKSQGGTYTGVVYDYLKLHPQKLVYVALSRASSIDGLYITNADNDFTFYHGAGNPDRALCDELNRLKHHGLDIIVQHCFAVLGQPQRFAICSLNVRSLAAHRHDVMHHHILM